MTSFLQCRRRGVQEEEDHIFDSFFTLRNSAMLEKYFWLASATFFSAACGFTISSPYRQTRLLATVLGGVKDQIFYLERRERHAGAGS